MEHHIGFNFSAPYYTLNELSDQTTDIWIACPGYGQLGKYFIRRFDVFDAQKHFVIVLQGLSKFYLPDQKNVGASWMTKEGRETDMQNQRAYFDAVIEEVFQGRSLDTYKVHLLGFSQGVSMISRMAAYSKINFETLVLWAGGFPPELGHVDFEHVSANAKLKVVIGSNDEFYALDKNYQPEVDKMETAIGLKPEVIVFEGIHEVKREVSLECLS